MSNQITDKIYEYENYRFFLRDFFVTQKKLRVMFSHRFFAQKAGFASSSFCSHVIDGKRNLTEKSLRKMIKGLGISGKAASYFKALVKFNQAKSVEGRQESFRKLESLRRTTTFYKVNKKQLAYFDKWYYPVIRELAVYGVWGGDYSNLASLVRPSITPDKARKAVETLVELGLLSRRDNGTYSQSTDVISVGSLPSPVTRNTRRDFITRAVEAMESMPIDERQITGCTAAMSEKDYNEVVSQLEEIRKRILTIAMDSRSVDKVYQFNFQAFPLSHDLGAQRKQRGRGGAR